MPRLWCFFFFFHPEEDKRTTTATKKEINAIKFHCSLSFCTYDPINRNYKRIKWKYVTDFVSTQTRSFFPYFRWRWFISEIFFFLVSFCGFLSISLPFRNNDSMLTVHSVSMGAFFLIFFFFSCVYSKKKKNPSVGINLGAD